MIIIGIDTGLDGAIAMSLPRVDVYKLFDMPTLTVTGGKKKKRSVDALELARTLNYWLESSDEDIRVFIEKVHAMPGQGVTSMFSMGESYGVVRGVVASLMVPTEFITPQAWKKEMMAGMGKEKDASRQVAKQLFPSLADDLKLKKHHGRADALLIMEYGRRKLNGKA